MDHTLRCNILKCRKELNDHAVVTTCCHVFCIDCSNRCQLSSQREGQRQTCPACDVQLTNPDDVVVANLSPTEDYKTSVLSGLHPNVIMECAGRALNFWAYQTMQEIVYQEYLAKNLTEKYSTLNMQMDKVVNDANGQLLHLRSKLSGLQVDQDNLRHKNEELAQVLREKSRKLLQTQELYDKLKRRAMLGQVQDAASDAVDDTIQASTTANRFVDRAGCQNQRTIPHQKYQNTQNSVIQNPGRGLSIGLNMGPPPINIGGNPDKIWSEFNSHGSQGIFPQNQPIQTPSTHRQCLNLGSALAPPRKRFGNLQSNVMTGTPISHQRISPSGRQQLSNLNANSAAGPGFAGYGMSAGLKQSNLAGSVSNGAERPIIGLRVAQRPGSGSPAHLTPAFGSTPTANTFSNGDTYY